jgi:hypothetical protein
MISRIPIYQMTFGQGDKGKPGLVFASEQAENKSQLVLFTIPVIDGFQRQVNLIDYLEYSTLIFPFELENNYYELKGKINFPEIIFEIPKTDLIIKFEIYNQLNFRGHFHRPYPRMEYVGMKKSVILKNHGFLVLKPIDLNEMNELYSKQKGIFVGLTPNFGNKGNFDLQ